MPFQDRFIIEASGSVPPGKFYFHTAGRKLFGTTPEQQIDDANGFLREVFRHVGTMQPFYQDWTFSLGAIWGDEKRRQKVVDVFGFPLGEEDWPGNPEAHAYVARATVGGPVSMAREGSVSCSEGLRIIGGELGLRAETASLREYISSDRLPVTGLFQGKDYRIVI